VAVGRDCRSRSPRFRHGLFAKRADDLADGAFVPALQVTRLDIRSALTADSAAATPRWRGRRILISWQVAACTTFMLIAAISFRGTPGTHLI
jgi:hypothetical protein